jgi:hypothetical protein
MSKIGSIALGLLAVFAISAAMSASASAYAYFIEGSEIASTEKVEVNGVGGKSQLESTIASLNVLMTCGEDTATGNDEASGKSKIETKFRRCNLFLNNKGKQEALPSCGVSEPVDFKSLGLVNSGSLGSGGEDLEDTFEPENTESEAFATIELSGEKCTVKGKYAITGTEACGLPEDELAKTIHEIVCTPAESAMELGAEPAYFYYKQSPKQANGKREAVGVSTTNIGFIWKVEGAELGREATKSIINTKARGNIKFEARMGTDPPKYVVECTGVKQVAGSTPMIEGFGTSGVGGKPGALFGYELEFEGCTVTTPASGCEVRNSKIITSRLASQLSEGVGSSARKVVIPLYRLGSTVSFTVNMENAGAGTCSVAGSYPTGHVLLAAAPQEKTEEKAQVFKFEADPRTGFILYNGGTRVAGLQAPIPGNPKHDVFVRGEITMELSGVSKWGPF